MKHLLSLALLVAMAAPCWADGYEFHTPERLTADGQPVQVESPGYAAPWLADIDGDGIRDLLVGQFRDGKINVYKGTEPGSTDFAAHQWLPAGGDVAKVPGVW